MENIDLIDKYLSGGMTEGEIVTFEQTLSTDPLLKKEFEFQESIIEGLKSARMAELKTSLNAIDVSGITTTTSIWSIKTITAAAVVTIGSVATYFMLNDSSKIESASIVIEENLANENAETSDDIIVTEEIKSSSESKELRSFSSIKKDETEAHLPTIKDPSETKEEIAIRSSEVNDDFGDFNEDNTNHSIAPTNHMIEKGEFEHSTINVVINNNKKKYSFHYQVKDNTLFLYGDFGEVYEVLDFKNGEGDNLFFLYDTKYYNIKENQMSITPLEEMSLEETMDLKQKINSGNEAKSQ